MKEGVRGHKSGIGILNVLLAAGMGAFAQTPTPPLTAEPSAQAPKAQMSAKELNEFCILSGQLMEAGGISVPDLHNAAAPLIENVKQSCVQLKASATAAAPTYTLLMNLRAFNSLADSVPKPFPFPETASRQFSQLRDSAARLDAHFRALIAVKEAAIVAPDRDNLDRYTDANRKIQAPNPKNPRVVFLGDSITDIWRLNEYFPDRDFINRGISGQVTSQMLARFKADVLDLQPDAVLILGGTNDLARGVPLTAIENNYQMLGDLASFYKLKVIFASVLPVSDYHKADNPTYERSTGRPPVFINALNDWLEKLCAQRGYTYLNYFDAVRDNRGMLQADLSDDGLHPNSKGYRVMAPIAIDAIQKTVRQPTPAAKPTPGKPQEKPSKARGTSK